MPPVAAHRKPSNFTPRAAGNSAPTAAKAAPARAKPVPAATAAAPQAGAEKPKPEAEILFQDYFKSVGPRTYAAQVKRAGNGNHFIVFTEGKRDEKTDEIRKTRLFVFSEDFGDFFRMLQKTAQFIRDNPVPAEVAAKRKKFWERQNGQAKSRGT